MFSPLSIWGVHVWCQARNVPRGYRAEPGKDEASERPMMENAPWSTCIDKQVEVSTAQDVYPEDLFTYQTSETSKEDIS